ncbi:YceD family protein [Microvirga antarctica]|uniref:YceD family protein n=1 Tax=Microvirga antarctica TaxID=2819233 RepID=UPI001FE6933D|nr:YceD family protein [Microvirga antarctica]
MTGTRTMTPDAVGPLSRLIDVGSVPPGGKHVHVHATADECRALAKDFGLEGIHALAADFTLTSTAKGVHVVGVVKASITQTCVASLEPFDSSVDEAVEVDFAKPSGMPAEPPTEMHEYEPPDEIVNGKIDLGAVAAEFLALGLDPYPRKPGVDFDFKDPADAEMSPFSALGKLKGG